MAELLAFDIAEQRVHSYTGISETMVSVQVETMDRRNCEAFLQMGIDAFEWLILADRVIRRAIFRGEQDFDPRVEAVVRSLCLEWQRPLAVAEKWIALQEQRGHEIDNLAEFRRCVEEMAAIVEANAEHDETLPDAAAQLRNLAVQENRDGQTAEFI